MGSTLDRSSGSHSIYTCRHFVVSSRQEFGNPFKAFLLLFSSCELKFIAETFIVFDKNTFYDELLLVELMLLGAIMNPVKVHMTKHYFNEQSVES